MILTCRLNENAKDLAQAAGAPYADAELLNTAYNLFFSDQWFLTKHVVIGEGSMPSKKHGPDSKPCLLRTTKIFVTYILKDRVHIILPILQFTMNLLKKVLSLKTLPLHLQIWLQQLQQTEQH